MKQAYEDMPGKIIGGLEAGGTKMVGGISDTAGVMQSRILIPTTTPEETIPHMID